MGERAEISRNRATKKEWQKMRWLGIITSSMGINLSKLQEIVGDKGAWHAVIYRVAESQT